MRRGQRKLWREVATSSAKVAESKNHAEEYIYGIRFTRAMEALLGAADASTATADQSSTDQAQRSGASPKESS